MLWLPSSPMPLLIILPPNPSCLLCLGLPRLSNWDSGPCQPPDQLRLSVSRFPVHSQEFTACLEDPEFPPLERMWLYILSMTTSLGFCARCQSTSGTREERPHKCHSSGESRAALPQPFRRPPPARRGGRRLPTHPSILFCPSPFIKTESQLVQGDLLGPGREMLIPTFHLM